MAGEITAHRARATRVGQSVSICSSFPDPGTSGNRNRRVTDPEGRGKGEIVSVSPTADPR